jgi:HEAT repeat protein
VQRSPGADRPDIAALAKAGDRGALRRAVEHPDPAIRARGIDALTTLGDVDSARLIRDALRGDGDDHVREEAAVAIGRLRCAAAVDDLMTALQSDRSEHVREEAALALGRLGDERAVPVLLGAMEDQYTMVHRAAAEALEMMGGSAMAALEALAAGGGSPGAEAARAALRALAGLKPGVGRSAGLRL